MNQQLLLKNRYLWIGSTLILVGAYALHILILIDINSLWADELSTIYKTVELNRAEMLSYLSTDAHPPLYYLILHYWFSIFTPSTITLRLVSWIFYLIGGIFITLQSLQIGYIKSKESAWVSACLGSLIAFCSPFAINFAIEGKGYSLTVMLIAAGLFCRQRYLIGKKDSMRQKTYLTCMTLFLASAGMTHFYGLFLTLGLLSGDIIWALIKKVRNRALRLHLAISEAASCIPVVIWIAANYLHLLSRKSISWIGEPGYGLFESVLANYIGPFPIPKLGILGIVLLLLSQQNLLGWRKHISTASSEYSTVDLAGVPGGIIMVFFVIIISFIHPLAYGRYFIVLLPIIGPFTAVCVAQLTPKRPIAWIVLLSMLMTIWSVNWNETFGSFAKTGPNAGVKKSSNYRAMSLLTADKENRYTVNKLGHAGLADLAAKMDDHLEKKPEPWRSLKLDNIDAQFLPGTFTLAATGRSNIRSLNAVLNALKFQNFNCSKTPDIPNHVEIYQCIRQ